MTWPVGVGLTSRGPTGVLGLTIMIGRPSRANRGATCSVTVIAYEAVNPLRLQVPHRDAVMVVIKVERQVPAHDAKTDDAELRRLQGLTRGRHESLLSGGPRLPQRWSETPLP